MQQGEFECLSGTVTICSMTDRLCLIVESLHSAVVDSCFEVIQNVILMPSDHPCKISQGFQSGMSGPPKPLIQILFCACGIGVGPKLAESFLQQICTVYLEVELFQFTEPELLIIGQVPGVLEPYIACFLEKIGVLCFQLSDLFLSNLIHGAHEMSNDMKFVEYQQGIGKTLFDHLNVRSPHVAANSFYLLTTLFTQLIKESVQGFRGSVFTVPQQPFSIRS